MNEAPSEPKESFNIVRWSVDNPYVVVSFFLAMLVLGYLAIGSYMPRRFMPYVESPMLGIVTESPGLSAEEMETYFSSPIEQRMVSVPGVRYIRSTSQEGFSMVVLEYPFGSNMQRAQTDVQSLKRRRPAFVLDLNRSVHLVGADTRAIAFRARRSAGRGRDS